MKRKLFLVVYLLCFSVFIQAQSVKGKVSTESGDVLPGVSVLVKGTNTGTITDLNGDFKIDASPSATLVFSFIGYTKQEVGVNNRATLTINLIENATQFDEVVVTALGINREKRSLGYTTQTISSKDLTKAQAPTIAQGLMGKVAGLQISNASGGVEGGSSRVVIRGNTSLTGDNRALIIVDGVALNNDPINRNGTNNSDGGTGLALGADVSGYNDWGTGMNMINPEDIQDVTVLKGPAAAALYGARGANGVILITRKKGERKSGLGVDYSYSQRTTKAYEFLDFQNEYGNGLVGSLWTGDQAKQFPVNAAGQRYQIGTYTGSFGAGDYQTGAYGMLPYNNSVQVWDLISFPSGLSWGPKFDNNPVLWYDGVQRPYSAQPDNWKAFFPNGNVKQHNISVNSSGDFGTARFSYTRDDNQANILNSNFGTNTFNIGSSLNVSKKIKADITGSYINYERLNTPPIGSGNFLAGFSYAATRDYRSDVELLNNFAADGSQKSVTQKSNFPVGSPSYPYYGYMENAFWNINKNNTTFNRNQLIGGLKFQQILQVFLM